MLPAAAHPAARADGGHGHDPQDALEAARRRAGRERADALPGPGHDVRLQPGRLRHGLPVLRHRPGRADPQHVHGRDRRAGRRGRRALAAGGEVPGGPGRACRNVVFMGMGEPLANYKRGDRRRPAGWSRPRRRAWACRSGTSRCPPSAWCRPSIGLPPRISGHACAVAARPGRRAARRAGAGQHPLEGRRGARRRLALREATGRRVSIEYALIRDVNDQAWRADLLGTSCRRGEAGCTST